MNFKHYIFKTNYKIKLFLIILFLGFINLSYSQDIKATAELDTNSILIGDQVNLNIKLKCPVSTKIIWTALYDTITNEIEIIKKSKIDTIFSKDKKQINLSQTLIITSFDSGYYVIPAFQFIYDKINDTTFKIAKTNPLFLNVQTIPVDTTKAIKDIKPPLKAPVTFREVLPYILTGIAVAIIILLIIYYIKKRKKKQPLFQLHKKPKLLPHKIALDALEKLRIKKLWQKNKIKEYHSELTQIIRTYIKQRFNINALEMTSDEILHSFKKTDIKNEEIDNKLKQTLALADLVKFAKENPLPDENDKSMNNAIDFVKKTIISIEETSKEISIDK